MDQRRLQTEQQTKRTSSETESTEFVHRDENLIHESGFWRLVDQSFGPTPRGDSRSRERAGAPHLRVLDPPVPPNTPPP